MLTVTPKAGLYTWRKCGAHPLETAEGTNSGFQVGQLLKSLLRLSLHRPRGINAHQVRQLGIKFPPLKKRKKTWKFGPESPKTFPTDVGLVRLILWLPEAMAGPTPFKLLRAATADSISFFLKRFLNAFLVSCITTLGVFIWTRSFNLGRKMPLYQIKIK